MMSWPDGDRYLRPLQSLAVSLLFLGLDAYCFIKILCHTDSIYLHRETCAPSSRSLCPLSSTLQRTQPTVLCFLFSTVSLLLRHKSGHLFAFAESAFFTCWKMLCPQLVVSQSTISIVLIGVRSGGSGGALAPLGFGQLVIFRAI